MGTSYEDIKLRRARVFVEPAGAATFAVNDTGTASDFADVPLIEGSIQPKRDQQHLNPASIQQYMDGRESEVLGIKSCSLTFAALLASHGLDLDGTTTAANCPVLSGTGLVWPLARVLATIMGGYNVEAGGLGAQTKAVSGISTTGCTVTAGHGVRFKPGSPIAFPNPTTNLYEVVPVKTVSTDTLTFKQALTFSPATNAVARTGPTFYITEDPQTSLQLWIEGNHDYDKYVYLGLQGGFSLDTPTAGFPKLTFNLKGPNWTKLSNTSLAAASFLRFSPSAMYDSVCRVSTVGSTTTTNVPHAGITFKPNLVYGDVTTPAGVQTVLRHRRLRQDRALDVSIETYWDNTYDWDTAHDSRLQLCVTQQIGSAAPGSILFIEAPTVQVQPPQEKAQNNLAGRTISAVGRLDQEIGQSTELNRSVLRISCI